MTPQPTDDLPATKPKRWPLALVVAFITGVAGAVLTVPISDWAMEAHHVSAMEGGRACAAIGLWAPLGFIVSFATGFFVSMKIARPGFVGYVIKQIVSLLIAGTLILAGGGLGYATADHPPVLNGQTLALEIEVRAPTKGRSIEDLKAADFDVALVVSVSDRNYSDLRWDKAVRTDEFITLSAWAPLNSRGGSREVTVGTKAEARQRFTVIRHGSPKKIDEEWSEWTGPRADIDGLKPSPADQYQVRYRVRYASEYSPTPAPHSTPVAAPDESPTPEESPAPQP